jgi:hypothetical protein
MLSFKLDFKDLKSWIDKQPKLVDKACLNALYKVAEQIEKDTKPDVPLDTKELVDSYTIEKKGKLTIEAGYDIVYAMYQHQGRRADGTHIIRNRPAGGKTFFLKSNLDKNAQKYIDLFAEIVFKELNYF